MASREKLNLVVSENKRYGLQSKSFEENERDFRKVHGNKYLYSESTKRNNQFFTVTCPVHGNFKIIFPT